MTIGPGLALGPWLHVAFYVLYNVAYGLEIRDFVVGNRDSEVFLDCHENFDYVEGVGAEVFLSLIHI